MAWGAEASDDQEGRGEREGVGEGGEGGRKERVAKIGESIGDMCSHPCE